MTTLNLKSVQDEKGFTLVELAVVMVIIGLLIGGILKGQEMIANQQVNSTIAQVKAIEAAVGTFRDIYDAFPGDMANADDRLPNCTGTCIVADGTEGDNVLSTSPLVAAGADAAAFFPQLVAADLMAGTTGPSLPGKISNTAWYPGYTGGAALGELDSPRAGHYMVLGTSASPAAASLVPLEAARMDRKVDDGVANSGSAGSSIIADTCSDAGTGVYQEAEQGEDCGFVVRING